jgi:hypothetical protein
LSIFFLLFVPADLGMVLLGVWVYPKIFSIASRSESIT